MDAYTQLARLYDTLMDDVDYDAWAAYYGKLLALAPNNRVADLGCGTGAFAIRLAKQGHAVTGVDLAEGMLARAQENARAAGVKILFARQDIQKLTLPKPVDAILCACDGINYLTTLLAVRRCFAAVFAALKPGGRFAFDVSSQSKLTGMAGQLYGEDREDLSYLWFNDYNSEKHLLRMSLTFFLKQENGLYRRCTEEHLQRAHTQSELQEALAQAGFADIHVYGDQLLLPPKQGEKRLHFAAQKP